MQLLNGGQLKAWWQEMMLFFIYFNVPSPWRQVGNRREDGKGEDRGRRKNLGLVVTWEDTSNGTEEVEWEIKQIIWTFEKTTSPWWIKERQMRQMILGWYHGLWIIRWKNPSNGVSWSSIFNIQLRGERRQWAGGRIGQGGKHHKYFGD